MSRWMMPLACAASSASAIWIARSSNTSISSGCFPIRCFSVRPSSSSMAMKYRPLDRQVKQYVDFQWLLSDTLFQRPAFQQLHGNEVPAIGLANFINCADVGMVQRRGSPRFALKALQSGGIFFQFTRQKLQCNMPPEVEVLRRIDHTHATAA